MQAEKSRPEPDALNGGSEQPHDRQGFNGNGAMIERLEKVIKDLHGFKSTHLQSVPIEETFQGETVWKGIVELFQLHHHPRAGFAYAWAYKDDGKEHYVAVLGVPPVNSPIDAVRAYIAAETTGAKDLFRK
jgi:hypothetical protein